MRSNITWARDDDGHREELIAGLLELASYLESHPAVPAARFERSHYQHCVRAGTEAVGAAEVNRIADTLGAKVERSVDADGDVHYSADATWGPVVYCVWFTYRPSNGAGGAS